MKKKYSLSIILKFMITEEAIFFNNGNNVTLIGNHLSIKELTFKLIEKKIERYR